MYCLSKENQPHCDSKDLLMENQYDELKNCFQHFPTYMLTMYYYFPEVDHHNSQVQYSSFCLRKIFSNNHQKSRQKHALCYRFASVEQLLFEVF
eukprot:UN23879